MTKSDELVRDFYKGQARRYKLLAYSLVFIIALNITGLFWLRMEQQKSNQRLEEIAHTLTDYVAGYQDRAEQRAKDLQTQHDKLYKGIVCLVALHDKSQLDEAAESECHAAAEAVNAANNTDTTHDHDHTTTNQPAPAQPQTTPEQSQQPSQPQNQPLLFPSGQGVIRNDVPLLGVL